MKILFILLQACLLVSYPALAQSNHKIPYSGMNGISGVAWTKDGYIVVGDKTNDKVLVIDGSQNTYLPLNTKYTDLESIDSVVIKDEPITLILSEDNHTLFEMNGGGVYRFSNFWAENCGRGLEGLAVEKDMIDNKETGFLRVAVIWEGGYAQIKDRGQPGCDLDAKAGDYIFPRIATFIWKPNFGVISNVAVYDIATPFPGDLNDRNNHQRFRATDMVWHGNSLLVLLGSTYIGGDAPYKHTWLQAFCPVSSTVAVAHKKPKKLRSEPEGQDFFNSRNWEALDWGEDNEHLIFGYDGGSPGGNLAKYKYDQTNNNDCKKSWFKSRK